jgi:hypothetical protein
VTSGRRRELFTSVSAKRNYAWPEEQSVGANLLPGVVMSSEYRGMTRCVQDGLSMRNDQSTIWNSINSPNITFSLLLLHLPFSCLLYVLE